VNRLKSAGAIAALVLGLATPVFAGRPQAAPAAEAAESPYTAEEVMVPMRDGARLQTVILRPRNRSGALPILFSRTPYGVTATAPKSAPKNWAALDKDGYIYVSQSMRGRFKSDGVFTLSTAVHPDDPNAIDEATDAYDSIDWLVKNVPNNNGKVGMWGVSYPGFAAAVALAHPHPALKAVSPQAAFRAPFTRAPPGPRPGGRAGRGTGARARRPGRPRARRRPGSSGRRPAPAP